MSKPLEYVIAINHAGGIWFYIGTQDHEGNDLPATHRYSSLADDAKVYSSADEAQDDVDNIIPRTYTRWVMTSAVCPTCHRRYVGAPALSRKDNRTAICPDCGTREAIEAFNNAMMH